ncbi:MAG: glycosyltransferase family 2 protein [Muribaculaceae bacterium]
MKQLTVIIVNYKVKYFLEQTIRSVEEAMRNISGEIIVIDNNSGDDTIEFLRNRFTLTAVDNKINVGFAGANNAGIRMAKSQYTLILNPDTIIGERVLTDSINWIESHEDCGGIGVKMLDGNGVFLPESKRAFPSPWVSFCKIFGLSSIFPYSKIFAKYHLRYLDNSQPHKINIMAGAYMFIRTNLLQELRGFDEDFFMYGEDIDLSYRISLSGYNNYYLPSPIIHYKGESTKEGSMQYVKVFYQSMIIFFKKHYPNYSKGYAIMIRAAVHLRAAMAMAKRLLPAGKRNTRLNTKWIVISAMPQPILTILSQKDILPENISAQSAVILTQLQDFQKYDIVLDNRHFSYQEIIDFIEKYSAKHLHFHIYSSQSNLIISPKMQVI